MNEHKVRGNDAIFHPSSNTATKGWREKISDHIAYALLVYTGLQIFLTIGSIHNTNGSLLPYFALVALVGAMIPAFRMLEGRWEKLCGSGRDDDELRPLFRHDIRLLWLATIGIPVVMTLIIKLV